MWNDLKKYLILLAASVLIFTEATEKNSNKKNPLKTSTQKQELTENMFDPKMFDPMTPQMSKEQVNSTFKFIADRYMNCEWPKTLKSLLKMKAENDKKNGILTATELAHYLFAYKSLINNPELQEVTQTRTAYFNQIGRVLMQYLPVLQRIEYACESGNEKNYPEYILQYENISDRMEAAIKDRKKYKITAVELRAIRNANIARRTKEIAALKKRLGIVEKKQAGKSNRRGKK